MGQRSAESKHESSEEGEVSRTNAASRIPPPPKKRPQSPDRQRAQLSIANPDASAAQNSVSVVAEQAKAQPRDNGTASETQRDYLVPGCMSSWLQTLNWLFAFALAIALLAGTPYFALRRGKTYECADKHLVVFMDIMYWANIVGVVVFISLSILLSGFGCASVYLLQHLDARAASRGGKAKQLVDSKGLGEENKLPNGAN